MKSTSKKNISQLNTELSSEEIIAIGKKAYEEAVAITWKQTEVGRTLTQNDKIALVDERHWSLERTLGVRSMTSGHSTIGGANFQKRLLSLQTTRLVLRRQKPGF